MNRKKTKTPKNKSADPKLRNKKRKQGSEKTARRKESRSKSHRTSANNSDSEIEHGEKVYDSPVASREEILVYLRKESAPRKLKDIQIAFGYGKDSDESEGIRRRLVAMSRDGQLISNRAGAYLPINDSDLVAGFVSANTQGFGFVICDDGKDDVYLSAAQMRQVLHGDKVVVCITGVDHRGRREGRITDVVERAHQRIVGQLVVESGVTFVVPDNKRIHLDILVAADSLGDASNGDIVVVEIIEQPSRKHPPVGRVVEVLGEHLQAGMEIDVALHNYGIPSEWPIEVDKQTAKFKSKPGKKDKHNRRNISDLPLVTIDGEDARDFDDAVYCEKTATGWRLYVAIADVSHYVKVGTPLDDEAQKRGTSVYFPEQVVPMLPEVLSNGLCSINPQVERLCMLCTMSLAPSGELKRTRFQRAVMTSHARLTYNEVNAMLTQDDKGLRRRHKVLLPHLENLHKVYKKLKKLRAKRGCIEFESQESKFIFDENRKINEILPVERNDAHKMIEECMVLANVAAAAHLLKAKMPALYRVHNGPTADRLDDLRSFLALRNLSLGGDDKPHANDFAALAKEAEKLPDSRIIQMVMLRSMQAAVYTPVNDGHFGLALDHYAHFTSPIRRYPDLLVHRAIGHLLDGGKPSNYGYSDTEMASLGETCSMTERRAEEATRDVVGWLKCEYMQHHIGDEYLGVISSVTSFGLFVQLDNLFIDGLVHVSTLGQDYFQFDPSSLTLRGERTGVRYGLGDTVRVRIAAANLDERKIDFEMLEILSVGSSLGQATNKKNKRRKDKGAGKDKVSKAGKAKNKKKRKEAAAVENREKQRTSKDVDDKPARASKSGKTGRSGKPSGQRKTETAGKKNKQARVTKAAVHEQVQDEQVSDNKPAKPRKQRNGKPKAAKNRATENAKTVGKSRNKNTAKKASGKSATKNVWKNKQDK